MRVEFHRQLERLDISIGSLLTLVPDAVVMATSAVVGSDAEIGAGLDRWRGLVSGLYEDVDHTIEVVVARQQPVAGDLRFLLACVRIVPALRDAIELVGDLAAPSRRELGSFLTPRITALIERLGEQDRQLWADVDEAWRLRDEGRLQAVRKQVDWISDTRSTLVTELASGAVDLPIAIELAILSRIFDRLAHRGLDTSRYMEPVASKRPGDLLA